MAAEPIYDAAGVVTSSMAVGTAAVALMGLSGTALFWAFLGAAAGLLAAKSIPRFQAVLAFIVSAPASALLAKGISRYIVQDDGTSANIAAFVIAAFLPYAIVIMQEVVIAKGQELLAASLDRLLLILGVSRPPEKPP